MFLSVEQITPMHPAQTSIADFCNPTNGHVWQFHTQVNDHGSRLRAVSCGRFRDLEAKKQTMPCSSKASALRFQARAWLNLACVCG
jgi:hypothetical protein